MGSWALPAGALLRAGAIATAIEDRIRRLDGRRIRIDPAEIITGRAALLGFDPPTRVSAGGASRLLHVADGWCALTLSRTEDRDAVPALLEIPDVGDPWKALADVAATRRAADLVARARLLDMPAATLGETPASDPVITQHNPARPRAVTDLLVVDMSSMWAGPLSGRLLAAAGATVVKVETAARPDGTRGGDRRFYDWLNAGKLSFSTSFDSDELPRLLRTADVVIEGSRPAALARRGLSAEHLPARPGRVWVSISGYGRDHPDRVAFGDDAAVAGGLVIPGADGPVFCGDAIADPLTGLAATAAVVDALAAGGGVIIDVSMAAIAAAYAKSTDGELEYSAALVPDLPAHPAHALGADNSRVRDLIEARAIAC